MKTDIQYKIYNYLARSAGTANVPTDHTILCFIGMIQTGEATMDDMEAAGGKWLVERVTTMALENGWSLTSE